MSEGERRLAAIMYTDIVGYTALTQRNESDTMRLLEDHRALIRPLFVSHRGREIKTIGDAFLVEFQSALDAVLCAVAIQQTMHDRKLATGDAPSLRIGVHIGDVIEKGNDVLGDSVNIASRIYPLAEPGGVCISDEVYKQVRSKSDLAIISLGEKSLKNVGSPVEVYKMVMPWSQDKVVPQTQLDKNRIAVLPFANISPDPADEYLADGMTEELITTISGISELSVISRTSVMRYKGTSKGVDEIGRELKVGAVLEGSVRKAENTVRITAQLIDVGSDKHLWAQSYDRELRGIFAIQSDIANKIAEALRMRFVLGREPARKAAENIEAYTLYLKGRSLWNRRDKEGVLSSLKLFQEAVRIDPGYARAYSGLADAYRIAAGNNFMDRADGLAKSKEATLKALELDATLAEAHASLGLNLDDDLRYEEALREFRRSIELNPSYATAHHWYSMCLSAVGRMEEAQEEMEKARELDPLSQVITLNVAAEHFVHGRLDDAVAVCDKLIENEPTIPNAYAYRAIIFMSKGMKAKAYADLETYRKLAQDEDVHKLLLAQLYGWFGEREKALPLIEELIPKVGKSVSEGDFAECYALLGDKDEFFNWIDKAIAAKRIVLGNLRPPNPIYDKVRDDPRFPEIFKRLGLSY